MDYEEACNKERSLAALPHCVLHRVFQRLSPRDLSRATAVCRLWRDLNRDVVGERRWRQHYSSRWPLHRLPSPPRLWAELYSEKVFHSSAYGGRFFQDSLFGHKAGVRCIQLLPHLNLLATGSLDRTVRMWDLEQGMQLCRSRLHEGTVRSLVLRKHRHKNTLLLFSGSETTIRLWMLPLEGAKLSLGESVKLKGHTGPISSLDMAEGVLLSGSWDCSVCLWSEMTDGGWCLASRYVYSDWVWAVHAQEGQFFTCCGRKVLVQSLETGAEIASLSNFMTEGHVACCTATLDGRFVLTGGTDGVVRLHSLHHKNQTVEIARHAAGVTDITFEDPWVAAGSLDGTISLLNLQHKLHPELHAVRTGVKSTGSSVVCLKGCNKHDGGIERQLQCHSGPVYCLDMSNQWITCGAERPTVRTWDFTKAVAAAKKAEIARTVRRNRKNRSQSLTPLQAEPLDEEKVIGVASDEESTAEADSAPEPEPLPSSCRLEHRRKAFWKSFGWGDSTDDSEIIDAFG